MKTISFTLILLFWLPVSSVTQTFELVSTTLPGVNHGGSCWGDFDNDGDLDLALNGQKDDWTGATFVYRNENGTFVPHPGDFPALYGGSVQWGDFDRDNDLDLLVCGMNTMGSGSTILLRNDNGTFVEITTPFTGIAEGDAIWLDENRDGWPDVLIGGDTMYNTPVARLYRNNGDGTFLFIDTKLPASINASYTTGDYDNDGDDDIFVTGYYESTYATRLLRNDNDGSFTDTEIAFDSIAYGDMIFLDIDLDMDLDIVYIGADLAGAYIARVYRNDGDDQFTKINQPITGEWVGQVDAADVDNDGDPDLAITGALCCGEALTEIYTNDGNGHFTLFNSILPPRTFSQIRFGDFDNDGDADLLLTGLAEMTTGLPMAEVYRNNLGSNTFSINNPPDAPQDLTVTIDQNDVTFSWTAPGDDHTPSIALTYNLYVGVTPGSCSVFAPLSDSGDGFRQVYAHGNAGQETSWKLMDLPAGTYYWSVQALDHSLSGSLFSPEQSFEVTWVGNEEVSPEHTSMLFPNPSRNITILQSPGNGIALVYSVTGQMLDAIPITQEKQRIDLSYYLPGLYIVKVIPEGQQPVSLRLFVR